MSEEDVLSYNVLRSDGINGSYVRINPMPIQAKGSVEITVNYEILDDTAQNGKLYSYKLVENETNGDTKEHGPVTVVPRFIYGL